MGARLRLLYLERFGHAFSIGMELKDGLAPAVKVGKLRLATCACVLRASMQA